MIRHRAARREGAARTRNGRIRAAHDHSSERLQRSELPFDAEHRAVHEFRIRVVRAAAPQHAEQGDVGAAVAAEHWGSAVAAIYDRCDDLLTETDVRRAEREHVDARLRGCAEGPAGGSTDLVRHLTDDAACLLALDSEESIDRQLD